MTKKYFCENGKKLKFNRISFQSIIITIMFFVVIIILNAALIKSETYVFGPVQISSNSDDAYDISPTELGAYVENGFDSDGMWMVRGTEPDTDGWRFVNVTIPKGATITNARLSFFHKFQYSSGYPKSVVWYCENSDNAETFSDSNRPSQRQKTIFNTTQNWSSAPPDETWENSTNLASCIQEVINREGWQSGNSIVIISKSINDTNEGGWTVQDYYRDSSKAAKLTIEYNFNSSTTSRSYFDKCKNITIINPSGENLLNFPVYINLNYDSDMLLDFKDVRFFNASCGSNASLLDYEIENYTTGETAHVWVRIPVLSSTNTTISVYYKNKTGISDGQNPKGVWDENYVLVHHLEESCAYGNCTLDSSNYGNNGTPYSGSTITSLFNATGRVGPGYRFDGINDVVRVPDNPSIDFSTNNFTVSAWFKITQRQDTTPFGIIGKSTGYYYLDSDEYGWVLLVRNISGTGGKGIFHGRDWNSIDNHISSSVFVDDNAWHQMVIVVNNSNVTMYIDGNYSVKGYNSFTTPLNSSGNDLWIGSGTATADVFDGFLDEIRLSKVARSPAWISMSYWIVNNQSDLVRFSDEIDIDVVRLSSFARITINGYLDDWVYYSVPVISDTTNDSGYDDVITVSISPDSNDEHTCGIINNRTGIRSAYCWGLGSSGQLGYGGYSSQGNPVSVNMSPNDWMSITSGDAHTCGILYNGSAYCWGTNYYAGLGSNSGGTANPVAVNITPNNFSSISSSFLHTCGILYNGSAYCWGNGQYGRLGDGNEAEHLVYNPIPVNFEPNNWKMISAGGYHTCGILYNGSAYCWGQGDRGQLGDGNNQSHNVTTPVAVNFTPNNWTSISVGTYHTCGILYNGSAYCWGDGSLGQVGDNLLVDHYVSTPTPINTTTPGIINNWSVISAGGYHTCGVLPNGTGYCWGIQQYGVLGNGQTSWERKHLVLVLTNQSGVNNNFTLISAFYAHTCGILRSGSLYCWGNGQYGKLGDGIIASHYEGYPKMVQYNIPRSYADLKNYSFANDEEYLFGMIRTENALELSDNEDYYALYLSVNDSSTGKNTSLSGSDLPFAYDYAIKINKSICVILNHVGDAAGYCDFAITNNSLELGVNMSLLGLNTSSSINYTINISLESGKEGVKRYDYAPSLLVQYTFSDAPPNIDSLTISVEPQVVNVSNYFFAQGHINNTKGENITSHPLHLSINNTYYYFNNNTGILEPGDVWWNTNWAHRLKINITSYVGSSISNSIVLVNFSTSQLISQGKMRNDCGDTRFSDGNGNELEYTIETSTCNTNNTIYWVWANTTGYSDKTIYAYFGNPYATLKTGYSNPDNGLVLYMHFDNSSAYGENSTLIYDFSGQNNKGTCSGSACPFWNISGKFGGAYEFYSANYLTLASSPLSSFSQSSICAWIKLRTLTSPDGYDPSLINLYIPNNGVRFGVTSAGRVFASYTYASNTYGRETPSSSITTNSWNHVCYSFNGSFLRVYVNGVYADYGSNTYSIATGNTIGARSPTLGFINGTIDEIKVYARALSQDEILLLYNDYSKKYLSNQSLTITDDNGNYNYTLTAPNQAGNYIVKVNTTYYEDYAEATANLSVLEVLTINFVPPTDNNSDMITRNWSYINTTIISYLERNVSAFIDWNRSLIAWWNFENYNNTGIYDNSTYQNFATFQGGLNTNNLTTGPRGKGITLDGNDDYLTAGNDKFEYQNLTISAWVYLKGNGSGADPFPTIITATDSTGNNGWILTYYEIGKTFRFYVYDGGGGSWKYAETSGVNMNQWYHLVGIGDKGNLKLYINGNIAPRTDTYTSIYYGVTQTKIGFYDSALDAWFNGTIDEVMIFNRALSEQEIQALYNTNIQRLEKNFTGLAKGDYTFSAYAIDEGGYIANTEKRTISVNVGVPISSCGQLSTPNTYYFLTNNVSSNTTCFTITANNVTLDGNGYAISYSTNGSVGYGVLVSYQNDTTIKNLIIREGSDVDYFKYGIFLNNTYRTNVINNTIINKGTYSYPIYTRYCDRVNISRNFINLSNSGEGINMFSTHNSTIEDNDVYTSYRGMLVRGWHNIIRRNKLRGYYNGLYIQYCYNLTLENNNASATNGKSYEFMYWATYLYNYNHSIDTSNLAEGKPLLYIFNAQNQLYDGVDFTQYGQVIFGWGSNITIQNSNFSNDNLNIYGVTNGIKIINNTFVTNNSEGPYIESNNQQAEITGNKVTTNCNDNCDGYNFAFLKNLVFNNNVGNTTGNNVQALYLYRINNSVFNNNTFIGGSGTRGVFFENENTHIFFNNTRIYTINGQGIYFYQNNNNITFNTLIINSTNTNNPIYLYSANNNITITDALIKGSTQTNLTIMGSGTGGIITLLNVTTPQGSPINISWQPTTNNTLHYSWWLDTNITSATGGVNTASVNATSTTGAIQTTTTNSNGLARIALLEYTRNGTGGTTYTYYSNYTVNASKTGYNSNSTIINMSTNKQITLYLSGLPLTINISISPNTTNTGTPISIWGKLKDSNNQGVSNHPIRVFVNNTEYRYNTITERLEPSTGYAQPATNENGEYSYALQPPSQIGNYIIKINATNGDYNTEATATLTVQSQVSITFVPPTDQTGNITRNWTYINVTVQSPYNTSAFIDWNKSLIAWWNFENYNNTGIYDNSTYQNFASFQGGLNTNNLTTGPRGKGITLDGNDDYLTAGTINHNIGTGDFTWIAWVYPKNNAASWQPFITNGMYQPAIYTKLSSTGQWGMYWDTELPSGNTLTLNTWYQLAVVRQNGTIRFYQNTQQTPNNYTVTNSMSNNTIEIGRTNYYFNGTIDEVMIFNRALSEQEIQALYNTNIQRLEKNFTNLTQGTYNFTAYAIDEQGNTAKTEERSITIQNTIQNLTITFVPPTDQTGNITRNWTYINVTVQSPYNTSAFIDWNRSLIAWWNFEYHNATGVFDNSTYNKFGKFEQNLKEDNITIGKFGSGLRFDGSYTYLNISIGSLRNFTVSMWIMVKTPSTNYGTLFAEDGYNDVYFRGGGNGNIIHYYWYGGGLYGTKTLSDDTWYHIVVTNNNGTATIYVNGSYDNSGTGAPAMTIRSIGGHSDGETFNGIIDEVTVFNRVLSQEEINALFNAGSYRLQRNFTGLTQGTYNFTAYAIDEQGNTAKTEERSITITNGIQITSCGTLDQANTTYFLMNNVNSSGTCFNILADNITLLGQGFLVNFSTNTTGYGVNITGNNVVVKNININEVSTYNYYMAGIRVAGNNAIIQDSIISTKSYGSDGVYITKNNTLLQNLTINTTNQECTGVLAENSANHLFINNTLYSLYDYGFYLSSVTNATLSGNQVNTTRMLGYFIDGTTASHYNHSIDSTNLAEGLLIIYNFSIQNTVLYSNQNFKNTYGQLICAWCTNITYSNITIENKGISLFNTSNASIKNSNISTTNGIGVFISRSTGTLIQSNVIAAYYHYRWGIYSLNSQRINITSSSFTCSDSSFGIRLNENSNVTISNCSFTNSNYAWMLSSHNSVDVKIQDVSINGGQGISVQFSNRINIERSSFLVGGSLIHSSYATLNLTLLDTIMNSSAGEPGIYIQDTCNSVYINLTNTTKANGSKIDIDWGSGVTGTVNYAWWLDANITSGGAALEGATVNATDVLGKSMTNTTNSNGFSRMALLEYTRNGTGGTNYIYYSNYTINASKTGYLSNATIVNMSSNKYIVLNLNQEFVSSCLCPGSGNNWVINMSHSCNITQDCNLGSGYLNFTSTGYVRFNASINASGMERPATDQLIIIESKAFIVLK